jgi:hypothetical protein
MSILLDYRCSPTPMGRRGAPVGYLGGGSNKTRLRDCMGANGRSTSTKCIRERGKASVLPSFPAYNDGTEFEHFVELNASVNAHRNSYGQSKSDRSVDQLMLLRTHMNGKGNIFSVPSSVNREKRNITQRYLHGGPSKSHGKPHVSPELAQYIKEAAPIARSHVKSVPDMDPKIRSELLDYIDYMSSISRGN